MSNGLDVRWRFRKVSAESRFISGNPVLTHPLIVKSAYYQKVEEEPKEEEENGNYDFVDPLGATAGELPDVIEISHSLPQEELLDDHKTERTLDNTLESRETDKIVIDVDLPNFAPWHLKRQQILDFSAVKENITLTSNSRIPINRVSGPEKVRRRMEIMEDLSGLRKLSESSQTEFVTRIRVLRESLVVSWQSNKRVEALKIVTDMARMLTSTANASFYPEQWVMVTDALDLFGKFVYDRLLQKANEERRSHNMAILPPGFTCDDILKETTEVAKNWFCKISDIKELIPRFYVETALIASLRFLDSSSIRVNLIRLASMTSKFNHTLQAAYGRAYLSKISMNLDPSDRATHWRVLNDWMQSPMPHMPELTSFALEWIIQCVSYGASSIDDVGPLWEYCKQDSKRNFVVRAFLNGLSPSYIADHIAEVIPLLSFEGVSGVDLITLADRLMLTETPQEVRSPVLKSIWKTITHLTSTSEFLRSCAAWIRFISRYFSVTELSSVTESVAKRASADPNLSLMLPIIVEFMRNMLQHLSADLHILLKNDSFIAVLDILREEPYASQCAKEVVVCFARIYKPSSMGDFTVAYQMIDQCSCLCQSLKPDSLYDEVRSVCVLVCSVLDRFDMNSDIDRALSLLVHARSVIGDFPQIVVHIINLMTQCSLQCLATVPPSTKRNSWLRAAIANIFITIPSLDDAQETLHHALQGTAIALAANSLPQADSLMKLCAEMLNELPATPAFTPFASRWLALLVSVPDSPSKRILYLFEAFINVVDGKSWEDQSQLTELWVKGLSYLWAVSQPKIEHHFSSVIANDTIYGQSEKFIATIEAHVGNIMDKLLVLIEAEDPKQPIVSLTVLEFLVTHIVIEGSVTAFIGNLLKKVVRSGMNSCRVDGIISDLVSINDENPSVKALLEKLKII